MTVYAIAQFEYTNKEIYSRYTAKFWDVFKNFQGELLVNDENPTVLEGEWNKSKMVVMSFPSKPAFIEWATSPEYLAISKDRQAGANATIVLCEAADIASLAQLSTAA